MRNEALNLAQKLCSTMMNTYKATELPPGGHWHYHQGIFLWGMYKIYEITKDEKYFDYIKEYVDHNVNQKTGEIRYECSFDDAMTSILLFPIYERTGDAKYRVTLDHCAKWIPKFFKTPSGGFWHKFIRVDQMWLDGFYMAQPLCTKYASTFNTNSEFYKMAYDQLRLMRQFTRDEKTGLWYHAYDESRAAAWCDKETGKSPEFWGRAFGWIGAALVDILDYMPEDCEYRDYFLEVLDDYLKTVVKYQDKETGLWYQVLDKGDDDRNWPETSCSCLFVYTICKAMRMKLTSIDYTDCAKLAFEGIKSQLTVTDSDVIIKNICIGTGVGDYEHYINRPRTENDLHGSGAFLHAMAELAKVL